MGDGDADAKGDRGLTREVASRNQGECASLQGKSRSRHWRVLRVTVSKGETPGR